jgi:Flp pilus assembly pilin Flp
MIALLPVLSVIPDTVPAVFGTLLIATVFYGITAHLAARFVLGDVRIEYGLMVGAVPAVLIVVGVQLLGGGPGVLLVIITALVADFFAIKRFYDTDRRFAGAITISHFAISILLGSVLTSLLV